MASWIGIGTSNPGDVCTNGKIGIGTTSPAYAISMKGDDVRIVNQGITNTNYNTINVQNSDSDGIELVAYGRSSSGTYLGQNRAGGLFVAGNPNAVMGVGTKTNTPLVLGTNDTERMRIANNGMIGIGTTSPSYVVDIQGTSAGTLPILNVTVTSGSSTGILGTSDTGTGINGVTQNGGIGIMGTAYNGGTGGYFATVSATDIALETGTGKVVMNGSVGIGIGSPAEKLDVSGNIKVSGAGNGITLTSPDGSQTKKLRLSNSGTLELV